jgi:hypothetical protein
MNKELISNMFLDALKEKVPNRAELTNILVDLLYIEKESVYRRLRGEVGFSFPEVALIANHFGMSLDNIVSNTVSSKSRPFQLKLVDYDNPSEKDYMMMQEFLSILWEITTLSQSTILESSNLIPFGIYAKYDCLSRFYLMKWMYQSGDTSGLKKMENVAYPSKVSRLMRDHWEGLKHIKSTYYILDPLVFEYLVTDIKYFHDISILSDKDVACLKKDILGVLRDLEVLATLGAYPDTGNKVSLYVSCINFDTNYWHIESKKYNISLIKVFVLNNMATLDPNVLTRMKRRLDSLRRSSTLISVSGERERIEFFEKQRAIVSAL